MRVSGDTQKLSKERKEMSFYFSHATPSHPHTQPPQSLGNSLRHPPVVDVDDLSKEASGARGAPEVGGDELVRVGEEEAAAAALEQGVAAKVLHVVTAHDERRRGRSMKGAFVPLRLL